MIDGKVVAPDARLIVWMLRIRHVWHALSHAVSFSLFRSVTSTSCCLALEAHHEQTSAAQLEYSTLESELELKMKLKLETELQVDLSRCLSLSLDMCVLQVEFMCCNETFLQQFLAQLEVREKRGERQARHVNSRRSNCKTLAHKS